MQGQGSTEYLVLLAVVLIVAMVSVALLGFFPGMASDAQMTQSQTYWSGAARPFQVKEAASSGETMCGIAWAHGYAMVLQNAEADTLTVTGLAVDGSSGFCAAGGAANASVAVGPGERKTFYLMTASGDSPCTEKQIVELGLNITYRTAFIANKVQAGAKKLMLRCATIISAAANASGGNMTNVSGYRIHTFTSSGTFTANESMVVELLVVAGGGGGGTGAYSSGGAGGGGAGGLKYVPSFSLSAGQAMTVVVGTGGAPGGSGLTQRGSDGVSSSFGSITATGGGGGGAVGSNGYAGGSGGGGGFLGYGPVSYGGSGVPGEGNAGGATTNSSSWAGGAGGGGAGGLGGNSKINHAGGDGGAGLTYSITGAPATYAQGGGGGANSPASSPANTGKGGDAAYAAGTAYAGGSGIVVVKYR